MDGLNVLLLIIPIGTPVVRSHRWVVTYSVLLNLGISERSFEQILGLHGLAGSFSVVEILI